MKTVLIFLVPLLVIAETANFTIIQNILLLQDNSIEQALEQFSHIFLECGTWGYYNGKVGEEYAAAAKILQYSTQNIRFAVTKNGCESFKDKKFTKTLTSDKYLSSRINDLYVIGKSVYQGLSKDVNCTFSKLDNQMVQMDGIELLTCLMRYTKDRTLELNSSDVVNNIIDNTYSSVLFIGDSSSNSYKDYISAIEGFKYITFINSHSEELKKEFGFQENSLIVFNSFGTETNKFEGIANAENFRKFITRNQYPAAIPYTSDFMWRFNREVGPNDFLIFFRKEDPYGRFAYEQKLNNRTLSVIRKVASEFKDQMVIVSYKTEDEFKFQKEFQIKGVELPAVMILTALEAPSIHDKNTKFSNRKYLLEADITEENIRTFIKDYKEGNLMPYLRSAEIPRGGQDSVKTIVGKNWEKFVHDENKNVLIFIYRKADSSGRRVANELTHLFGDYKGPHDFVVGKIDLDENDILEDLSINEGSNLLLYPKGAKGSPEACESLQIFYTLQKCLDKHGITLTKNHIADDL